MRWCGPTAALDVSQTSSPSPQPLRHPSDPLAEHMSLLLSLLSLDLIVFSPVYTKLVSYR